jgi:hypothetical protein
MFQIIDTPAQRPPECPVAPAPDETAPPATGMADEISNYVFNLAASLNRVYAAALNEAERKSR